MIESGEGIKVVRTIVIHRPAHELYNFWRKLDNLPKFMPDLISVTQKSQTDSHWIAKGPMGNEIGWDAEIINETSGRLIAWQTKLGTKMAHAGTVRFDPVAGGTATAVTVTVEYDPPGGRFTNVLAKMVGKDPGHEIEDSLERLKKLVEL